MENFTLIRQLGASHQTKKSPPVESKPVVEIDKNIIAPVSQGEQKGILNVVLTGDKLVTVPLMALESVPEGGVINRLKDEVRLLFE